MLVANNKTLYEILSVKEDASYEEIRTRYKAAILNSHPDKLLAKQDAVCTQSGLQEDFLSIQKAWEVLCDPKVRAEYDRELRATRQKFEIAAYEINMGEMDVETVDDVRELYFPCRCGDYFSVSSSELRDMGIILDGNSRAVSAGSSDLSSASIILPCSSCSLKIRVVIDLEESTHFC